MNPEIITSVSLMEKESVEEMVSLYQFYKFVDNEEEIVSFVEKHHLLGILLEAVREIRRVFGKEILLELELHRDPEEEWDELFIVIKTNYPPEKAVKLEEKLFYEWFIKIIDKVNNKLNFTEEPL